MPKSKAPNIDNTGPAGADFPTQRHLGSLEALPVVRAERVRRAGLSQVQTGLLLTLQGAGQRRGTVQLCTDDAATQNSRTAGRRTARRVWNVEEGVQGGETQPFGWAGVGKAVLGSGALSRGKPSDGERGGA